MHPFHFLSHLQHDQVVQAIRAAEARTSGQIRVIVSRRKISDPLKAAKHRFAQLGLHRSAQRNGILIFVVPRSQRFAVLGDQAVHEHVGDAAWQSLAAGMSEHFKNEQFMDGILTAIGTAGELLATHFPKATEKVNPNRAADTSE